jgi:hypothetical protein
MIDSGGESTIISTQNASATRPIVILTKFRSFSMIFKNDRQQISYHGKIDDVRDLFAYIFVFCEHENWNCSEITY